MAFTEFYCIPISGSNTNAGSTTAPPVLVTSGGGWTSGSITTAPFYSCTGTQDISMITPGMFGAISTGSCNRVVVLGLITGTQEAGKRILFHDIKLLGRIQTMSGVNVRLAVGGPWEGPGPTGGPTSSAGFPFNFISGMMTNLSGDMVRVNLQNSTQYNITGYNLTTVNRGPLVVQGYSNIPGDLGRATLASSGHGLFTIGGLCRSWSLHDLIFTDNGTTGASALFTTSVAGILLNRCKFSNARLDGIQCNQNGVMVECEVTNWNRSGNVNRFAIANFTNFIINIDRCYIHDATGVNACGVSSVIDLNMTNSIIARIGGDAVRSGSQPSTCFISHNDFYKIGRDVFANVQTAQGGVTVIKNNNFIECSGFAYNERGAVITGPIIIQNNIWGSGTYGMMSGVHNGLSGVVEIGITQLPSGQIPWNNPNLDDFTLSHPSLIFAGRGQFNTSTGNAIISYPNIGSMQHRGGFPLGIS